MKKFISWMLSLSIFACCLGGCGSTPAADTPSAEAGNNGSAADTQTGGKPVVWKFATNLYEDTKSAAAYEAMFERFHNETGGEVTVEPYYQSALGSEADVLQNVQTGNIALAHVSFDLLAQFEPAWNVTVLPFLFDDDEHYKRWVATDEAQALFKKFQDYGLWFEYAGIQGFRQTNMVKNCLTSVEDYKGQTIRVMDNAVQMATLEALGATPITVPYSDVYNSLNMGVCDGWIALYTGMKEVSSFEPAPYVTQVPMFACSTGIVLSKKALDELSPESRETVMKIYREEIEGCVDTMSAEDDDIRDTMVAEGKIKEVYKVEDTKPFIDAVSGVWDDICAQYDGVKEQLDVIESVRKS